MIAVNDFIISENVENTDIDRRWCCFMYKVGLSNIVGLEIVSSGSKSSVVRLTASTSHLYILLFAKTLETSPMLSFSVCIRTKCKTPFFNSRCINTLTTLYPSRPFVTSKHRSSPFKPFSTTTAMTVSRPVFFFDIDNCASLFLYPMPLHPN